MEDKIKIRLFIIIGNSNTRKSSIIRALSGVRDERVFDIKTDTEKIKVFVKTTSLQEAKIKRSDAANYIIKKLGKVAGCNTALICLRFTNKVHVGKEFISEDCTKYLIEFEKSNFIIEKMTVLNEKIENIENIEMLQNAHLISDSKTKPSNELASEIRKLWNWV